MTEPTPTPEHPIDSQAPSFTPEEFNSHVRNYVAIFGSLLVLSLFSFAFWYFQLSLATQIVLTLLIASTQAMLNLRYLMHLKGETGTIKHFLILAAVFSAFLLGLSLLAFFSTIPGSQNLK